MNPWRQLVVDAVKKKKKPFLVDVIYIEQFFRTSKYKHYLPVFVMVGDLPSREMLLVLFAKNGKENYFKFGST